MATGDPTGADLCSGTTNADTLPSFMVSYEEREITIDTPVELTSGVKYAIVVRAVGAANFDSVYWTLGSNDLANGRAKYSGDSGSTWANDGDGDMWFKTKSSTVEKDTNTPSGTGAGYDIYNVEWNAQTFTALSTYTITSIILKLAIWPFATPGTLTVSIKATEGVPTKAKNPAPTDTASDVTLDQATLTWNDGGGADTYNVYYGTTSGSLTKVSDAQAGTSFTVTGITNGSPYNYIVTRYWRIDSTNDAGTTVGDEWSFTTINFDTVRITYRLISGGNGKGPYGTPPGTTPVGVEGDDFYWTGENNMMTVKRLVAAANNKFWFEE